MSKKLISLTMAIIMVLTMIPFVGITAGAVSADFTINESAISCTKADNNKAIYTKSFSADSTKQFFASYEQCADSFGGQWELKLTDSSGTEITPTKKGNTDATWNFTKDDTYTFSVICRYIMSGTVKCDVKGEFKNKPVDVQEGYRTLTAEIKKDSSGWSYVELTAGDYVYGGSLPTYSNYVIYRVDVNANTITCAKIGAGSHDVKVGFNDYPTLDKKYTYYISRVKLVEGEIPSLTTDEGESQTFTATIKTGLEKLSPSATVTLPKPQVVSVTKVTNQRGFKSATLNWDISGSGSVDGYTIKRYDSAGKKVVAKYNVTHSDYTTNFTNKFKYTIPYAGSHKFSVTPYRKYSGKTYYGEESSKLTCKSAPLEPAGGMVTKINKNRASIQIYKGYGSKGTVIYQQVGKKWKQVKKTTAKTYVVNKSKAGTSKYKFKSYLVENGKTYYSSFSKAQKPMPNIAGYVSSDRVSDYKAASHFWANDSLSYSGNKLVLKGKFVNSHVYSMKYFTIKVTVKYGKKVIGTKTISCGKISAKTIKSKKVTLDKSKPYYDLNAGQHTGKLSISYKVVKVDTI